MSRSEPSRASGPEPARPRAIRRGPPATPRPRRRAQASAVCRPARGSGPRIGGGPWDSPPGSAPRRRAAPPRPQAAVSLHGACRADHPADRRRGRHIRQACEGQRRRRRSGGSGRVERRTRLNVSGVISGVGVGAAVGDSVDVPPASAPGQGLRTACRAQAPTARSLLAARWCRRGRRRDGRPPAHSAGLPEPRRAIPPASRPGKAGRAASVSTIRCATFSS